MPWPPKPLAGDAAIAKRISARQQLVDTKKPRPKGRAIKRPEQAFQIELVKLLRVLTIPPAKFFFVPNGGNLSKVQAAKFKAMGLTPGVPDLHFIWSIYAGNRYIPQYAQLELKAGDGRMSTEQMIFTCDVQCMGHMVNTVKTVEEALKTLTGWGFPLRPHNMLQR